MEYILNYLKNYNCHYDSNYKIFTIRKPISVKEFMYVKYLLKHTNTDIYDIRVETSKGISYERRF